MNESYEVIKYILSRLLLAGYRLGLAPQSAELFLYFMIRLLFVFVVIISFTVVIRRPGTRSLTSYLVLIYLGEFIITHGLLMTGANALLIDTAIEALFFIGAVYGMKNFDNYVITLRSSSFYVILFLSIIYIAFYSGSLVAFRSMHLEIGTSYRLRIAYHLFAVLVAVSEEYFYRGFLLGYILKIRGTAYGVIISSIIFALWHGKYLQIPWLVLIGMIYSLVYIWKKRLIYPVICHLFINYLFILRGASLF